MADASDLPLLGGHLSLDFANTLEWRGSEREKDWLTGYDALVAWTLRAGAVEGCEAEQLRAYADWAPGSAAEVLAEARTLRAAFYRVASALAAGGAAGETLAGDQLDDLNLRLAPLLGQTRLNRTSAGLVSAWGGATDDLARVLWPVARAAFDLLTGAEAGRLRECAGRDCHWLFLDRSKNGSRRWCAMANCGNAAKARRHRARSQRGRRQNPADVGGQAARWGGVKPAAAEDDT